MASERRRFHRLWLALLAAVAIVQGSVTTVSTVFAQESGPDFERQNRVSDILRLLGAQPGSLIADVGAGEGAFTIPIARNAVARQADMPSDFSIEAGCSRVARRATVPD